GFNNAGPLYRVLGSSLSITCNVSGFVNVLTQQQFEFRVIKPERPTFDINIISTDEPDFGYAKYVRRVQNGEITLKHLSTNSVRFEIQTLEKSDEGEYECFVKNPESSYDGTYNAKTIVKVIDNSLSVSSSEATPLSYNEGDALTLACQASSNTIQHTHLSLAWFLHRDGVENAQPIISLDRDFTLSPGMGFEGRYQAGLIKLDKIGEATYRLKMAQLEVSDQGRLYCQAQEWIQDPDRSWYSIAKKDSEETMLEVKDVADLYFFLPCEGQPLSLSCSIDTLDLEKRFFSVAWLQGGVELARMGPTGVLSVGPKYSDRAQQGELRAARTGDKDYHLILQPVRTEDQGDYFCRAWPQNRDQEGAFTPGAPQNSSLQFVSISATGHLSVEMLSDVGVNEGSRLKLDCKVVGIKGQLSVTWLYKPTTPSTAPFASVIGLSQEGVTEIAEEFMSRKVRVTRPAIDSFTLELDEITPTDSGIYRCAVSEWKVSNFVEMTQKYISSFDTGSFVNVNLISRNNRVTVGGDVELICRVRGPRMPITVTWSFQRDAAIDTILTLYHDGKISWSGDQQGYQTKVQTSEKEIYHHLLINGASQREAGSYQCRVSVFLENRHKKLPPSNSLAVMVLNPESKLVLTSSPSLRANINTNVEIRCAVISEPSPSSRYAVTWQHQQRGEKKTIVSLDRDAITTFGDKGELSNRDRLSMRYTKGPSFELTIQQAQISDTGLYTCEVAEWLQDPRGEWYELSPVTERDLKYVSLPVCFFIVINLSIVTDDEGAELNVSTSQNFTIPCNIANQSSSESAFQVTWFWQKETGSTQHPIFIAYRNATLQDRLGKGEELRFSHPLPNQFSLTVLKPGPEDSGLYFCEVEEWLPSLSHEWMKFAVEKSGKLAVNVSSDGKHTLLSPNINRHFICVCGQKYLLRPPPFFFFFFFFAGVFEPQCMSGTWIGILVVYIVCSLLVIFLLVLKICWRKGAGGKKDNSLWAEKHALKTNLAVEE
uniref:Zgc:91849 n=1 Tax=Echeneis naucrates TaxID=173247 RepID=A0A665U026_ECHNA